jgi:hypothetical protein
MLEKGQSGHFIVFNYLGQIIYQNQVDQEQTVIDLSNQLEGVYLFEFISSDKSVKNGKIIIAK